VLNQGVQLSSPAVDSYLPGPQSAQPLNRQARSQFNAGAGRREQRGRQPDDLHADLPGRRPIVNMSCDGTRWEMKRTWHAGVIGLIKLGGGFGDLRITMDGEYSLYFHERQTGFCGAVTFYIYLDGDNRRTEIGPTHT
jgi:hypothetical protein